MTAVPRPRPIDIGHFGRQPATLDDHNLMFVVILSASVVLPSAYDFYVAPKGIQTPTFDNNSCGGHVIAGRPRQTQRYETADQSKLIDMIETAVPREDFGDTSGAGNAPTRKKRALDAQKLHNFLANLRRPRHRAAGSVANKRAKRRSGRG